MANNFPGRPQQRMLFLGGSVALAIVFTWLGTIWAEQTGEYPVVGALIWTGRLAFAVFLIPLFASPLRALSTSMFTARIMRWRRNAGICYGGIQIIHLLLIIYMFWTLSNPPTETAMVVIGGMGMLLCTGMLITSFDKATRALGRKRWEQLHKSGFYIFMFIYFYDFVIEPLMLGSFHSYALLGVITLSGMLVRTIVMIKNFRPSPETA